MKTKPLRISDRPRGGVAGCLMALLLCASALLACAGSEKDAPLMPCAGKCDGPTWDGALNRVCTTDGWCWSAPRPMGNYTTGLRRLPDGKLLVYGGGEALVASADGGKSWRGTAGDGWRYINDVWVDAAGGRAWAVGSKGRILRYEAGAWQEVASGTDAELRAVFGASSEDVWAVGDYAVLHWDGLAWSSVTGLPFSDLFADVWAGSAQEVWICGRGFVLRSDGERWEQIADENAERLVQFQTVWGTGSGEVYFGAHNAYSGLQRYDAAKNVIVPLMQQPVEAWNITDLSGTGPDDIWAVSTYQVWHFDGLAWSLAAADDFLEVEGLSLSYYAGANRVTALAPDDVWITGAHGFMSHFDGSGWQQAAGEPHALSEMIGAASDGLILAGGRSDSLWAFSKYASASFDGAIWSIVDNPVPARWGGGTVTATATATARFRVDRLDSPGPYRVFRHTDAKPAWEPIGEWSEEILTLWASGPDDVYAAGMSGVWHYDGSSWTATPVGSGLHLSGSADHTWVLEGVTVNGAVISERQGTTWTRRTLSAYDDPAAGGGSAQLPIAGLGCSEAIYSDRPGHGFIGCWGAVLEVLDDRVILHELEGHQAIVAFADTADGLLALGGSRYEIVVGLGLIVEREYGAAYRFDGARWHEEATGAGVPLRSAWTDPASGRVWAVSSAGIVYREPRAEL